MKTGLILLIIIGVFAFLLIIQSTNPTEVSSGLFLLAVNENNEHDAFEERIILGYCPTMKEKAFELKQENEKIELIEFASAADALNALSSKKIDQALIGRKAESSEINNSIKEKILKSGYTLVSKQKKLVNLGDLDFFEIETYLSESVIEKLLPKNKINYFDSKNQIEEKINQGKIVLIGWDDWKDDFGLIVVFEGNEKVKDFRGEFLYHY